MECVTCGIGGIDSPSGCQNDHCSSGGCNKLNAFDWLSNMEVMETKKFEVAEIRFKNGRKSFYRNTKNIDFVIGDPVVVDVPGGHHIGYVSLQGELVRLQMSKKKIKNDKGIRGIYRKASTRDLERWEEVRKRESSVMYRTREIIQERGLEMKLTDVEFQADGNRAIFFYSAEERVDFRKLIKVLALEFDIKIEMRQLSIRQEASRIGGLGACGRELCCSTWLGNFTSVTAVAAKYQNLSLNSSKLSGQCGRLKCCLNYELDTYMEALRDIPEVNNPLLTEKGMAILQKTDIFRKKMWFNYENDHSWHCLDTERVEDIIEMNGKGIKPDTLYENKLVQTSDNESKLNQDLEELDNRLKRKSKKKSKQFYGKTKKNEFRNEKE